MGLRSKFENGTLIKHEARLVARGFTQVSGMDYHGARLYASVMPLETFRALISTAALFNHAPPPPNSTYQQHTCMERSTGKSPWSPHPGYGPGGHRKAPPEGPLRVEAG